jgi:hypothetical protein
MTTNWHDWELEAEPRSVYHKIFGAERKYVARKGSPYGGHLRHRHDGNLDHQTALHWVLHDSRGAAVRNRLNLPPGEVADLLVEAAAMRPTEKVSNHINEEENHMRENFDVVSFSKRVVSDGVSAVSESQAFEPVKHYTDANRKPGEKSSVAFARIYGGDDDVGLNFRKMIQLSKGIAHPHVGA